MNNEHSLIHSSLLDGIVFDIIIIKKDYFIMPGKESYLNLYHFKKEENSELLLIN
jgi:hypothetical protein